MMSNAETDPDVWGNNAVSALDFLKEKKEEEELVNNLTAPLSDLPRVDCAFAYGSGVFPQPDNNHISPTKEVPMVDYILGVSSPFEWHSQNIQLHPNHYSSWLAYFGGDFVTSVAENVGVGVHFNAFVPWHNKTIKYGVIGTETLLRDVSTWQRLYISGRLQKPVRYLVDHIRLEELNESNLRSALCAALLLLPSEFSEEDLYATICGLSYTGDVRMFFAEDKNKVRKIVQGSASKFQDLYRGSISNVASTGALQLPTVFGADLQSRVFQDDSMSSRSSLLSSLPSSIMQQLAYRTGTKFDSTTAGYSEISEAVVCSKEGHAKMVRRAISSVVRASSFRQMVSGFLAAGGINAGQYVAQKVIKAWRSRQ